MIDFYASQRVETKFKEIMYIISDDDDQFIGTLKKRVSKEVKKEYINYFKCTSKQASKDIKIQSKSNDYVNNYLFRPQETNNFDESRSQPKTSPVMKKN